MKIIKDTRKANRILAKCPMIYLVGCWASFGIREYKFAGRFDDNGVPYVWEYTDGNGEFERWISVPLTFTTTGHVYAWTTCERYAEELANAMNSYYRKNK